MARDDDAALEPPPPIGGQRPISTAGARFSRYLRSARQRHRQRARGDDPTNPPLPLAPETTL